MSGSKQLRATVEGRPAPHGRDARGGGAPGRRDRRPARARRAAGRNGAGAGAWRRVAPLLLGLSGLLAACGGTVPPRHPTSAVSPDGSRAATGRSERVGGLADVAFAGSLELLDNTVIGPRFAETTGARYQGRGGGSYGLAHEILAGEITPNVFESIGGGPIRLLEPGRTRWYVRLAASPIVVAYNPKTADAAELSAIRAGRRPLADLFRLFATPGFLLGRTNPNTDPQGQAFVEMVDLGVRELHLPSSLAARILGPLDNPRQVFAETALESRLEAGQLDASSAFLSQAIQLHLPYISLPPAINFGEPADAGLYAQARLRLGDGEVVHGTPLTVDVTLLGHEDQAAATAFVLYLLSPTGRAEMRQAGYDLLRPTIVGDASAVPARIRQAVARAR